MPVTGRASGIPGAWVGSVSVSRCELRIRRSALRGARRLAGPPAGGGDQVGKVRTAGAWSSPMPVIGNVPWHLRPGNEKPGEGQVGSGGRAALRPPRLRCVAELAVVLARPWTGSWTAHQAIPVW